MPRSSSEPNIEVGSASAKKVNPLATAPAASASVGSPTEVNEVAPSDISHAAPELSSPSTVPVAVEPLPKSGPPPAIAPPFAGTASAADGQWREFGAQGGDVLFWRTLLHPNEKSRFVSVDVVAIDLRRFRLEWVVGAGDVGASSLEGKHTPGLIGATSMDLVAAVFNGGFQARHGYWGQQSHGVTLVKPKVDGCGIALYEDGRVAVGSYEACAQPGLVTYRQTPPCLVNDGQLNPLLLQGRDAMWAGKSAAEKTRRRSAVGLTKDRQTLFYAVGVETEAIDLAHALTALGAEYGLQLDINWNWTRFFLVQGASNEAKTVGAPLLDGMVADKGEYFGRPSKRDFFAVLRRQASK